MNWRSLEQEKIWMLKFGNGQTFLASFSGPIIADAVQENFIGIVLFHEGRNTADGKAVDKFERFVFLARIDDCIPAFQSFEAVLLTDKSSANPVSASSKTGDFRVSQFSILSGSASQMMR